MQGCLLSTHHQVQTCGAFEHRVGAPATGPLGIPNDGPRTISRGLPAGTQVYGR